MKHKVSHFRLLTFTVLLILLLALLGLTIFGTYPDAKVSKLGEYHGYSYPIYDGYVRVSRYITVRDGTRLAADIFHPAVEGKPVEKPLPVIWTHNRYHRAAIKGDALITCFDSQPWLREVIKYGYVIGVVDIRGTGASYGTWQGPFSQEETWDAYDITEWFAAQRWSDENIGMFGRSYMGITQYMAASKAPPHLRAIFPEMSLFDLYTSVYPGGIFLHDWGTKWSFLVKRKDRDRSVASVDKDRNGIMVAEAIEEHQSNRDPLKMFTPLWYRDSKDEYTNSLPYLTLSPNSYLNEIKNSGIAVYHLSGWYDMWPCGALMWFKNLDNPQKIVIGPWAHTQSSGLNLAAEHLRWCDYWLKGIDNGIMDEPPIHYYVMGSSKAKAWQPAWQWPLPNIKETDYYLWNGPSGTVDSINDGLLSDIPPESTNSYDNYTVDYTTTSGKTTRWTNGYGVEFKCPDMTINDKRSLTYTTAPLVSDIEITGHPVVHLWVTSTAQDGDFFAYLEEIDRNGSSQYVSEGRLRASHRIVSQPSYEHIGLPYHRSSAEDIVCLSTRSVELVFDLCPISNIFDAGNRIRLSVTGADCDNAQTPELSPPPVISIYRNTTYPSYVTLPVVTSLPHGCKSPFFKIITIAGVSITLSLFLYMRWLRRV